MKKEYEHPVSVEGTGTFDKGIWHTISSFDLKYEYADGLTLKYVIDVPYVKFIGEKGWVRVQYQKRDPIFDDEIKLFLPGSFQGYLRIP